MTSQLNPETVATITVLLEDQLKRFADSPRMVKRIKRAIIAMQLHSCGQLIDAITPSNDVPAFLRRQAH